MAATRIYKNTDGFCLMLDLDADQSFIDQIEYPGITMSGDQVVIEDLFKGQNYYIPVADVRDSAGAAIGGQTAKEVRDYLDAEIAK